MEGVIAGVEGVISSMFDAVLSKKTKTKAETNSDLLEEIESVRQKLEIVESHFESQDDPDLIEASIYESKSLSARYRYLLREARKQGATKSMNNVLQHGEHF